MSSTQSGGGVAFVEDSPSDAARNILETRAHDAIPPDVPASLTGKAQYYYTMAADRTRKQWGLVKPWKEFFDRHSFEPPAGVRDSFTRLNRNINYYYHNYIIMALIGSSYVLLVNLVFSIGLLLTLGMWWYVSAKRRETTDSYFMVHTRRISFMQAYIFIVFFGFLTFYMANGSSVIFWLALSSVGLVAAHAVMRKVPAAEERPFSFV